MQRRISCHYYYYAGTVFTKHTNTACWAGVNGLISSKKVKEIYIEQFDYENTKKYQPLLIRLINKITPCEIIEIENKRYIKFTLLQFYNQTLILLNFIRNLWDSPFPQYSKLFFEKLEKSTHIDPLKCLTISNQVACKGIKSCLCDHSNASNGDKLILKNKDSLLNLKYDVYSTNSFLTS